MTTRINRQTNAALVNDYARNLLYGLPLDFTDQLLRKVSAITLEEARAVAAKYLTGDRYAVAVVSGNKP